MSGFLLRVIFYGLTLVCAVVVLPGILVDSLGTTLLGATVLGLANAVIRPTLTMFSIPLDSIVLAWTTLLTNITLPTVACEILPGIEIHNLITIIILISGLTFCSYILTRCIQDR